MHIRRVTIANRAGRQTELKRRRHINHLEIVRKKSIYGMWTEESYFIKAYLNDPMDKQRLASILDVRKRLPHCKRFEPTKLTYFVI